MAVKYNATFGACYKDGCPFYGVEMNQYELQKHVIDLHKVHPNTKDESVDNALGYFLYVNGCFELLGFALSSIGTF